MEPGKRISRTDQAGAISVFSLTDDEIAMIKKITDVTIIEFKQLEYLYRAIKIQGSASVTDIVQFAYLGIPIYQYLHEIVGVYPDQLRGYINQSKVTYPQVKQAFGQMTSKDGIYSNFENND